MSDSGWKAIFPEENVFWEYFEADYLFDFALRLSEIGAYALGERLAAGS